MNTISVTILLEYIYSKFITTFIMCLMGSFMRETAVLSKKCKKIHISKAILSGFFSSLLVCVVADYIDIPFSMYVVLCVVCGMWGHKLIQLFLTADFIKKILFVLLKNISGPLSKYADDMNETFNDDKNKSNPVSKSNTEEKNNIKDKPENS